MNMLTCKGYIAGIDADLDDGILVGRVINTHDIIGFHGETVSEATESFHAVIDEYLELSEKICALANDRGRISVALLSEELKANRNTIKKHLQKIVSMGRLVKHGKGRGVYYSPF
jgi:predicted HTH transcriptional regulator